MSPSTIVKGDGKINEQVLINKKTGRMPVFTGVHLNNFKLVLKKYLCGSVTKPGIILVDKRFNLVTRF